MTSTTNTDLTLLPFSHITGLEIALFSKKKHSKNAFT